MDVGTALSVVETLISALQSPILHEALSIRNYKSQLAKLQATVKKIKAALRDAEKKQELSEQDQDLMEELKDAVFEADDLFDEFVTLAQLKQLRKADGGLSEKARAFFSASKNPLSLAYRMSRGVKDIRKKLDAIAYDQQFSFQIDPEPTKNRRPETCSYVNENEIIGRQDDLDSIVGKLLDSNDQRRDVSVLSIVGIGGLGKTALAQLVFNDPRVKQAFPSKMWTCVSDENQEQLDVKSILVQILASITGRNPDHGPTLDQVQSRLGEELNGKKYLLVLDDVWTEKRDQWRRLADFLIRGEGGSWIVVTTRSKRTAEITGGQMHELSGLSKENSWRLFQRAAFGSDQPNTPDELAKIEIGQEIVDGCRGVPLAIRVAGSLLYGQDQRKWKLVQETGLANMGDGENDIMPILKLSFNHLDSPLKNCFQYCALFPKDSRMDKDMLIRLWMAQGYIVPHHKDQRLEDVGEEYYSILTRRCFFQDISVNELFKTESCKMHDLMHDIAQNVSGKEICAFDTTTGGNVDKNIRHLSISNTSKFPTSSLGKSHIRSLFTIYFRSVGANFQSGLEALVGNFRCLRVLDLRNRNIKHLPESIGELLHLRYIDLSYNRKMEALPNTITKLCNLQTLLLRHCFQLKELPKEFGRLVNLRVLDIVDCHILTSMPRGIGKLTCLHTVKGVYRVGGGGGRCTSWEQWFGGLRDLKKLVNLHGQLQIRMWWPNNAKNDVKEDRDEGLYLRNMEHVNEIELAFENRESCGTSDDDEGVTKKLMENLRPHSNLKRLRVDKYHGEKMPGWITLLPNLVSLCLFHCKELKYLPCLGNLLCHLKSLLLWGMSKLEYIEEEEEEMVSFFPVLEELTLAHLPKFKGWRRGAGEGMEESSNNNSSSNQPHLLLCRRLPHLKKLSVMNCPELTCIVVCPLVETLKLTESNRKWQMVWGTKAEEIPSENSDCKGIPNLMRKMNNASNKEELPSWMQYLSALQSLDIWDCKNLKAMPNWMPKLTSLQCLGMYNCSESLEKRCQQDPPGEDWPYIQHIPNIDIHV